MQRSTENILTRITYFILPLLLIAAVPSFISGGSIYQHYLEPHLIPEALGKDIITILCVPMIYWGHSLIGRGQQKGWVVFLAAFVYIFYTYSLYAFGGILNALFPVYVALVCLSFYGAITGFLSIDIGLFKKSVSKAFPRNSMIVFFAGAALILYGVWLFDSYQAHIEKTVPEHILIIVLDMAIILPAFFVAAWWLWKQRNWGYAMGGVLVLVAFSLGLSKMVALAQQMLKGFDYSTGMLLFYSLFTLAAAILCYLFWGAVSEKRAWTIVAEKKVIAPLEFVWQELSDFFQLDAPSLSIEKEKDGDPNNDQKGAIRKVQTGKHLFREELIGYEPYFSYSYKMLSGLPARDYVGTIAVTELGDGRTNISWDVNYRFRFPVPGILVKRRIRPIMQHTLDELKRSLEKKYDKQQEAIG